MYETSIHLLVRVIYNVCGAVQLLEEVRHFIDEVVKWSAYLLSSC